MTLYTSDTKTKYLIASAVILICSLVYEHFSHGVYSVFMLGAFLVPLLGGAIPCLLNERSSKRIGNRSATIPQFASVATLTVGSFMQGVLEIYGTTNRLMVIYPIVGVALAIAAICMSIKKISASS